METRIEEKPVRDLVLLFKKRMMVPNPEYQRGVVWTDAQQKWLIDSLFRGFAIPLIYLHERRDEVAGYRHEGLEIIDGQQRLTALHRYVEGEFRLFDPHTDNNEARFPHFLLAQECPWWGKSFRDLPSELKDRLLETRLLLAMIRSDDANEIRDLFVRLQAGSALNAQERRDARPGGMNEFVMRLGGKPELVGYPGHDFFRDVMGARPKSDRGKTRQLAAQITSLLLFQQTAVGETLPDIDASAIDHLYYDKLDFDPDGPEGRRILAVFNTLHTLLRDGNRPRLKGHDAIHAALLVDRLQEHFTPAWQEQFAPALDFFLLNLKGANKANEADPRHLYWSQYGMWTRVNSDRGESVSRRHSFYVSKMLHDMPAAIPKYPRRQFSDEVRELIYLQQGKKCAVCGVVVSWTDAEIHHVEEHHRGGKTALRNAALVHKVCHPLSEEAVADFAERWARSR